MSLAPTTRTLTSYCRGQVPNHQRCLFFSLFFSLEKSGHDRKRLRPSLGQQTTLGNTQGIRVCTELNI
jgi:hypothetical protein